MARITINGIPHNGDADPETPLLWILREQLGLTDTKYGCSVAQCGAGTVHVDGRAAFLRAAPRRGRAALPEVRSCYRCPSRLQCSRKQIDESDS